MDELETENQIILLQAIRLFYLESENKEIVLPMIFQWFNERSTQFVPSAELNDIIRSLYEVPQKSVSIKAARPFTFRFS